jgi:protein arginine N-methyltransferase 1
MGYCLLYESMLNTVLVARDKYLAPGGLIFPDRATMVIQGIEDGDYKQQKIGFWEDVYGFNFSHIQSLALKEPLVDTVDANAIATTPCVFRELDLYTVKIEDLKFTAPFSIKATRSDYIHAFICYFDIVFSACHKPVVFSTGPEARYTHWKQTVFYLRDTLAVKEGEEIQGTFSLGPNKTNERDQDIKIEYAFVGETSQSTGSLDYVMC